MSDARHQLFLLHELLGNTAALLRAEGHHGAEADAIAAAAAARRATCATC